ncbi:ABC transporter ATP-binding protein [Robertmurraya siralis]|uniref:ABC transporter ATP-binding protein n=1 Tax=Robertmurraya siralis TaxID=77777 RepID=A0A919WHP1_9BACI|nr:ABC transporter ATP-binding protein [Robertmurraya siralis]PAE20294.1 macrolide ABC transporter ATP-binding protein [Bacillus sp. 7504-2]GIN62218.1 ABC transporter ATP-binding protein [Robertmurraya siralis]
MKSFIQINNLLRTYQVGENEVAAVNSMEFEIEQGEFVVILGPSGSGKSTLLNLLGGMDQATSGTILIEGNNIAQYSLEELSRYRRSDIGFVFQFYNLIPNLTAKENVDLSRKLCKDGLDSTEMLEAVGLAKRLHHFPAELSGGEQQRVSIARALCKKPKLLLCDEPTGALDSNTGALIMSVLWDISKKYNQTVIVVTHNAAIADTANKVIRLKDGKVIDIQINENPLPMNEVAW